MTSPRDEEFARIRGYLQAQAAKLSIPELADKVRSDMEQLRQAIEAVPAGRFATAPADGEWSANEVLAHLTETTREVIRAINSVVEDGTQPPPIPDQIRGTDEVRSGEQWWQELVGDREAFLARVRQAKGDEHLDVTWDHRMFGPLNWREWLLFLRLHDLDHARQLQDIAAAGD